MEEVPFVVVSKEEAQAYLNYRRKARSLAREFLLWSHWVCQETGLTRREAMELILGLASDELGST
jgi:tRNA(His) 5'-end guanylyltransferase